MSSSLQDPQRSVARSAAGVSLATLASRILGYVRDMLVAAALGTGPVADAWVVAFQVPNLFRRLLGEGALQASFIPVFVSLREKKGADEAWRLASALALTLAAAVAAAVLLGEAAAPALVRVMVPGFSQDPGKLALTARLVRITLPFLWLISLAALGMGMLNGLRHFSVPALCPALLNIAFITYLAAVAPSWAGGDKAKLAAGLGAAVLAGGTMQLVALAAALRRRGWRPAAAFRHPQVGTVVTRMAPAALGLAVYQLNVLVDRMCASFQSVVGEGAVAGLYYGFRLMQFPHGMFAVAISTTVFPALAAAAAGSDQTAFLDSLKSAIRWAFALAVPAAVGLAVLRYPLVRLMFQRGEFSEGSVQTVTRTLLFYSLGLAGYAAVHILSRAFYSLGDTTTPVRAAAAALGCNIALNLILMWPLGVGGLALATSLTATTNALLLARALRRRMGPMGMRDLARSVGRTTLAAALMGVACWASMRLIAAAAPAGLAGRAASALVPVAVGVASYLGAARLIGASDIGDLIRAVRRRA